MIALVTPPLRAFLILLEAMLPATLRGNSPNLETLKDAPHWAAVLGFQPTDRNSNRSLLQGESTLNSTQLHPLGSECVGAPFTRDARQRMLR